MANDSRRSRRPSATQSPEPPELVRGEVSEEAETTGRTIVVFERDVLDEGWRAASQSLKNTAGIVNLASSADFDPKDDPIAMVQQAAEAGGLMLPRLGIAVVDSDPEQQIQLRTAVAEEENPIIYAGPEYVNYPLNGLRENGPSGPVSADYFRGFRDATDYLCEKAAAGISAAEVPAEAAAAFRDTADATWGLQATGVMQSSYTGRGVRIAILDTGLDLNHPDFRGRRVVSRSFVPGDGSAQDSNGHGTHCAGTACGPLHPRRGPRYGIAYESELYVGKVLGPQGGADGWIIAAIEWAIANGCRVISMSLAPRVYVPPLPDYEAVGRRALANNTLIVAAANNNARRASGDPGAVSRPANSESIMAVAAVDSSFRVADFSSRSSSDRGGKVDIAGPGVGIYSSWTGGGYRSIDGTSMATPHVSGIAALWSEANGGAGGDRLWRLLTGSAKALSAPSVDVGAGMVQAPTQRGFRWSDLI